MKKFFLFFILNSAFLILNSFCGVNPEQIRSAQKQNIDSILTFIKTEKQDSIKVNHLLMLCNEYRQIGDYDKGLKYGNEALILANSLPIEQGRKGASSAYNNIGSIYYKQGLSPLTPYQKSAGFFSEALKNYFSSLKLNEELKNKKDIAGSYHNIGIIYYYLNNYPNALKNYYAALNIREELLEHAERNGNPEEIINNKLEIAISYNNIGAVYDDPENYQEALKNYFAALKIYEEIDDKKNSADSYNNIGRIYNDQDNYTEALKMYFASLKINQELLRKAMQAGNPDAIINDKEDIAFSYNNIGNIYWNRVNYPEARAQRKSSIKVDSTNLLNNALKNYFAALKLRDENGDKSGIAESYINIGNVQMGLKKFKEAADFLNKGLLFSKETRNKEWIKESYSRLEELDSIQNNWKAAYQHHKLFILYRDSIDGEETNKKAILSAMNLNYEKKEAAGKAELDKKNAVAGAIKNRQQLVFILVSCILILVFSFAGFIFRAKLLSKKIKMKDKNKLSVKN